MTLETSDLKNVKIEIIQSKRNFFSRLWNLIWNPASYLLFGKIKV